MSLFVFTALVKGELSENIKTTTTLLTSSIDLIFTLMLDEVKKKKPATSMLTFHTLLVKEKVDLISLHVIVSSVLKGRSSTMFLPIVCTTEGDGTVQHV